MVRLKSNVESHKRKVRARKLREKRERNMARRSRKQHEAPAKPYG